MLMRLRLNRGLERTQIPAEFVWYNPSSLCCFQMYNKISIKISRHWIKTTKKEISKHVQFGDKVKEAGMGSEFGSLGFIVLARVRLKENLGSVWCFRQHRVLLLIHSMCVSWSSTVCKYYFTTDPPGLCNQELGIHDVTIQVCIHVNIFTYKINSILFHYII